MLKRDDKLLIRNKIIDIIYEISKGKYRSTFEIGMESYELKRCLDFILCVFDEVQKIETTKFEELDIRLMKKEYINIQRTFKLLKLKYKLK